MRRVDERGGPVRRRRGANASGSTRISAGASAHRHRDRTCQRPHNRRRPGHADRDVRLPRRGRCRHRHCRDGRVPALGRQRNEAPSAATSQWRDGPALRFLYLSQPRRLARAGPIGARRDQRGASQPPPNTRTGRRARPQCAGRAPADVPPLAGPDRPLSPRALRASAKSATAKASRVDERLVEGLAAGRAALAEISEKLARADVSAFETQGRFIQSRYGEERIDG